MSIGALAIGDGPLGVHAVAATLAPPPPPPKRTIIATSDSVAQPEPR